MSTLVAGIDEVGLGPILGPLVVASSIFLIEEDPEEDMWLRLNKGIGKQKRGLGDRILVCDSKKAYSRQTGLKHLERTVMAFLKQLQIERFPFSSILPVISNALVDPFEVYPWYSSLYNDSLPEIAPAVSKTLINNMEQEGIKFIDFRCVCMDVRKFNKIVSATGNKAEAVLISVRNLIEQTISIARRLNIKKIIIYSDRLGGRMYYGHMLETIAWTKIVAANESSRISKYMLRCGTNELDIQFEVGADDKRLPVALASMVAKYIRERIMQHMNDYLIKLQPGLKPTAGYWKDGHRFLRDMVWPETLMRAGVRRADFVRIK